MTIKKLSAMPYAQAHVEISDDGRAVNLFSYVTLVARIELDENDWRWLSVYGLYSNTTRRHIGAFVREYLGESYQLAKMVYEHGIKYCLDTGEII